MKFLILALFVAVATAAPIEEDGGPVEVILNGVPEGQPIDLSDIVDIKLKEHSNGEVASTNLLHPFTAVGIAEAAAAAQQNPESEIAIPAPVILPEPVLPEVVIAEPVVVPEPVAMPPPVAPEVVLPDDIVLEPIDMPSLVLPEAVVEDAQNQKPVALVPTGEVFNDGTVSVTVNVPQEAGVFSTIQGWLSMVLNYFNDGVQTTHQIV